MIDIKSNDKKENHFTYELKYAKLDDLVTISPGTSVSRLNRYDDESKSGTRIYNQLSFTSDKNGFEISDGIDNEYKVIRSDDITSSMLTHENDLIMNMSTGELVRVSAANKDLLLPYNYSKVKVKNNQIDDKFLEYWVNESKTFKERVNDNSEYSRRLSIKKIKDIEVALPDMETQMKIGELYRANQNIIIKQIEKTKLINKLISQEILKESEEDE
ncbi:hypothetical protein [Abyssicoccus albus]|uniref:Type I restriction modification DNA specificity protein n=1 Tax=Abyssicoccus albus TaxID=1817405 RepID=A0A3N5BCI8_9BACL|nr:hypothetical protein [Abyssicoccus albus]RPF55173.1 hypothetical protein EDD62_1498 [Abyssicoccus albus]